jgi:hypothetical protein
MILEMTPDLEPARCFLLEVILNPCSQGISRVADSKMEKH